MKKLMFVTLVLMFTLTLGACDYLDPQNNNSDNEAENQKFEDIMELIEGNHFSRPQKDALYEGAIEGMIDSLDDPYTNYFSEEAYQEFQDSLGEEFVGVGITIENRDNSVVVQTVWPDSPAEAAGLRTGDIITHVDGENVEDLSYLETIPKVQGEEGTTVELGVERSGERETLYFTMTRETIPNPTVESDMFERNGETIGYIRVNAFGDETYNRFNEALNELEEDGIDGLMVDLRDNSGGRLDTVVNLLNIFLVENDKPMFSIEFHQNGIAQETEYTADGEEPKPYDIVTLINEFSASASEVFAAGMHEHGGYEVLGMESFGKGTMQSPFSAPSMNDDELHLSNGIWKTPEGNWINQDGGDYSGVKPTIPVERSEIFNVPTLHLRGEDAIGYDTVNQTTENAQLILNALYDTDLRTDGYFDSDTEAAVETFQAEYDLDESGVIDAQTAQALNESLNAYRNDLDNDIKIEEALSHFMAS